MVATMIYELRTYWAAADKLDALNARFRNLTLRLFARHGMQVVGFWIPSSRTPESGDLVYLLAFPDKAAVTAAWDAFRADPEWQAGKAASEVNGSLVDKVASVLLDPTDYSPLT
jgi:hypothetical protein